MGRSKKGKCLLVRQNPESFNYWWGVVQNSTARVTYQEFFDWSGMSIPSPWKKSWSWNVSQIMVIHDQEGKPWEMELVTEALQCQPVSPEKGVSLNCSHSNHSLLWTLRKLRMQDHRPQLAKVYKIWLNESWLLHLLLHRKALNFLAWDAASCVWSSIILSKIGTFPRGTKEVSTFKNTSTKSRHSMEYPSDKQNGSPPPTRLW